MFLKCCYYDVSHLEDPQIFAAALHQLSWKGRAEKVNRYRFEKDKRLCLGAGLLAQHMLEQAGVSDPVFSVNEFGKPVLSDRSDIHFNISHDGTLAVCVVCDRSQRMIRSLHRVFFSSPRSHGSKTLLTLIKHSRRCGRARKAM